MASPAQALAPAPVVDVPLSIFGGQHTGVAPPDLPEGLSPDSQDMAYVPGETFSRPCLRKIFNPSFGPIATVYEKTYLQPNGDPLTLALDASGKLWVEDVNAAPGVASLLATVEPGVSALSATAFGREYVAFSDLLTGQYPPLQFDGSNLDRVTQDGPGEPVTCANAAPPAAAIGNSGAGATYNVATAVTSSPNGAGGYTQLTITTTAPNGLSPGDLPQLAGIKVGGYTYPTFTAAVLAILSATSFTIALASAAYSNTAVGTVTPQEPALVRQNNVATATTNSAHGFQPGWQVQVSGIANTNLGGGIAAIARDGNGVVTVTTTNPHGLVQGSTIAIDGVTNPDTSFDTAAVTVASVPTPKSFTFQQGGIAEQSTAGTGNVQDVWTATAFIQSVPTPTSFTYPNIGPNDLSNGTGLATIIGQISPGAHKVVVMFLDRQGGITRPSPATVFYANGAQQMAVSDLPIGNASIVARILGITGAGGDNYFIIPATPQVGSEIVGSATLIPDNTTTSVTIDFADNTLFDGIAIDQTGNDLFSQRVLVSPIGFFAYASRLACWGDYSSIQNLLNMTLGAGTAAEPTTKTPGSGANDGSGGPAWTNPGNIGSPTSFADVAATAGQTSQALLAETFGFAIASLLQSVSVNFDYYYTGGSAMPGQPTYLSVQLLQNGIPIGTPQTLGLDGVRPGSSAAPRSATFQFPVGTLTPTEVNQAGFGFEVSLFTTATATHLYVRRGSVTIGSSPLVPAGWDATDSTSITGAVIPSALPGIYLQYQMSSAGGAFDCLISQPAYQDDSGTAILLPSTAYTFRVRISAPAVAGNLVADFYSPSQGQLAFAEISLAAGWNGFTLADFSAKTPAVIPSDILFRVYVAGVPAGQVATIAEMSAIYSANPTSDNLSFWSYVLDPEGFDQTTGLLGSSDDPSAIRCFDRQRNVSLLHTASGTHDFQDNHSEPDKWIVDAKSRSVGACSIRAADAGQFGTGDAAEDWSVVGNQNGLYLFAGGDFWKISQELDKGDPAGSVATWEDVNWAAEQTLCVKNDPKKHRIYILAPVFGATQPNIVWMLDYKELDTSSDLANAPSLKIGMSAKMLATDKSRKWSRWNIASNAADILLRPGNLKEMTFAGGVRNGAAYGNLYTLDAQKFTDDDYGQMAPYYDTYGFVNHEQEEGLDLGTGRKLGKKICAFIAGIGFVTITPLVDSLHNPLPATTPRILSFDSNPANLVNTDLEWTTGARGQRIFFRIQVEPLPGETDVQMRLQKLIVSMTKDPVIYHRASAV